MTSRWSGLGTLRLRGKRTGPGSLDRNGLSRSKSIAAFLFRRGRGDATDVRAMLFRDLSETCFRFVGSFQYGGWTTGGVRSCLNGRIATFVAMIPES